MDVTHWHHQAKDGRAKPCELRRELLIPNDPSHRREVICRAGEITLQTLAEGEVFDHEACTNCAVPDALQSKLACMSLRPVRMGKNGHTKTYFACRWYYATRPDRQPETIGEACTCCDQWFPRPPFKVLEMLGYWPETAKIREAIANPTEFSSRWYRPVQPPYKPTSFKGRLIYILAWMSSNLRPRPMC